MQELRIISKISNSDSAKRLDFFYFDLIAESVHHADWFEICQKVFVFSHGNAEAEHGFSVNKQTVRKNMRECSIVVQRVLPSSNY